jgi:D-sedoheptulose 7-phosphate isomerase
MIDLIDASSYFSYLSGVLEKIHREGVEDIVSVLLRAYDAERMVYLFGNGGSAALASHFACDLGKGTLNGSAKRFRVMALTDNVPLITAWANDSEYEDIFAQQLASFIQEDDVAFAISGSGNSPNVLRALELAKQAGGITVGLTGFSGGKMKDLCDFCVIVPSDNMQIIEDLHLCIAHAVFSSIRRKLCRASEAVA